MKKKKTNKMVSWDSHLDNKYGRSDSESRKQYEKGLESFKTRVLAQKSEENKPLSSVNH